MEIKKNLKLNYLLGNNYILFPATKDGWTLARSGSYRVVMTSEKNTDEELDKFVKEHREYNPIVIITRFCLIANTIILGLCIANLFIHSEFLSHFNFGAIIILLPMLLIINYIGLNNRDVFKKYWTKILHTTAS